MWAAVHCGCLDWGATLSQREPVGLECASLCIARISKILHHTKWVVVEGRVLIWAAVQCTAVALSGGRQLAGGSVHHSASIARICKISLPNGG